VAGARSQLSRTALFAKNFVRYPKMLGSAIPSSRFLIRRLLEEVDFDRARLIVEYGPGIGSFTHEILRRMRPDALLVVVETNPDFVTFLRETYSDRRLCVVHGSAAAIEKILRGLSLGAADYVVSGIPFSMLPAAVRRRVLRATSRVLQPHGAFLLFQFSPKVLPDLRQEFRRVRRGFEPRNIPPALLYFCRP
jgi:phospholipid N-methyltransferase